ncbi:hypothetical protein [Mycolicibacterium fortuitum]|uniref:hypothetical protein n=1 Tax=Mycolicibacterium fortuitum TaxID=1766 RepID=UPI0007ED74CD|nr:hypothetical protein [Mycolicibacterium fortuitum]
MPESESVPNTSTPAGITTSPNPAAVAAETGPQLSDAPDPRYAQDRVTTKAGPTVYRDVIVDERSPDEVYVHLSIFTT